MTPLLIVVGIVFALAALSAHGVAAAVFAGLACFSAILARMSQSRSQHLALGRFLVAAWRGEHQDQP